MKNTCHPGWKMLGEIGGWNCGYCSRFFPKVHKPTKREIEKEEKRKRQLADIRERLARHRALQENHTKEP